MEIVPTETSNNKNHNSHPEKSRGCEKERESRSKEKEDFDRWTYVLQGHLMFFESLKHCFSYYYGKISLTDGTPEYELRARKAAFEEEIDHLRRAQEQVTKIRYHKMPKLLNDLKEHSLDLKKHLFVINVALETKALKAKLSEHVTEDEEL